MEDELLKIGFFEFEANRKNIEKNIRQYKIYENYNGIFLRIVVTRKGQDFKVDDIYFDSPKSGELQFNLFGNDLSVKNVIKRIEEYRGKTYLHHIPETS